MEDVKVKATFAALVRRAVLIPATVLLLLTTFLVYGFFRLQGSYENIRHVGDVMAQAQTFRNELLNLETGMRGYLLAGDRVYLEPFIESRRGLDPTLERLAELVRGNPTQREHVVRLRGLATGWLAYAQDQIARREMNSKYKPFADATGKAQMDALRAEIAAFLSDEDHSRQDELNQSGTERLVFLGLLILLTLLLVGSFAYSVRRQVQSLGEIFDAVVAEEASQGQALERSRDDFAAIADAIPQLAWITNEVGYAFWFNQPWLTYTGSTLNDMKGWGWAQAHHPSISKHIKDKWRAHLASGKPWEGTFPLRAHDGSYRNFNVRVVPIKDKSGRTLRWLGLNTETDDPIYEPPPST